MNDDNNFMNQEQNYSGMDNYYNQNPQYSNSLGEVPEPDRRPGCLISLLGFFLTIALMVSLTTFLMLFVGRSSISNGLNTIGDMVITLLYEELANDTEIEEALDLLDCELSDIVPEDTAQTIVDAAVDTLVNSKDYSSDNLNIDYDNMADCMYNVSEKAIDKALDEYIDYYKTGTTSKEMDLLDSFLVDVVGYDLESEFMAVVDSYNGNISDEVLEQAKTETKSIAINDVKTSIDDTIYNNLKPNLDDAFSELNQYNDIKEAMSYLNIIPTIMYGALIVSAAIILIQFLMYKQKYRAFRNLSVVCFFDGSLFALFSLILKVAKESFIGNNHEAYDEYALLAVDGFIFPYYLITAILIASFVITLILSIIMRYTDKRRYSSF